MGMELLSEYKLYYVPTYYLKRITEINHGTTFFVTISVSSEAYLKLSWTSTMELFWENNWRLNVVNYFRKIAPSYMFDRVLNTLLLLSEKALKITETTRFSLCLGSVFNKWVRMGRKSFPNPRSPSNEWIMKI